MKKDIQTEVVRISLYNPYYVESRSSLSDWSNNLQHVMYNNVQIDKINSVIQFIIEIAISYYCKFYTYLSLVISELTNVLNKKNYHRMYLAVFTQRI